MQIIKDWAMMVGRRLITSKKANAAVATIVAVIGSPELVEKFKLAIGGDRLTLIVGVIGGLYIIGQAIADHGKESNPSFNPGTGKVYK